MTVLKDKEKEKIVELFAGLEGKVTIAFFTQEFECQFCAITRELLEEVAALSDRLALEVRDLAGDPEAARRYAIDKVPAIALAGEQDSRMRFFGVPAGFEFPSLLEGIVDVSRRRHGLAADVLELLGKVDAPVHLEVFVSPTCPYCPGAVRAAHRFAMASPHVRGDMIEVSEFPHLAVKHQVQGVPMTLVNGTHRIAGAAPELLLAKEILKALGKG